MKNHLLLVKSSENLITNKFIKQKYETFAGFSFNVFSMPKYNVNLSDEGSATMREKDLC